MGPTSMILQWIACFIVHTFNQKPPIRDLDTVEIIDNLIEHYRVMELHSITHGFLLYNLPMKDFKTFKELIREYINVLEYTETPKLLKLLTINYEEVRYSAYFKKNPKGYLSRDKVREELFDLLDTIKKLLSALKENKNDSYDYYSARANIIISHSVSILEALTHE